MSNRSSGALFISLAVMIHDHGLASEMVSFSTILKCRNEKSFGSFSNEMPVDVHVLAEEDKSELMTEVKESGGKVKKDFDDGMSSYVCYFNDDLTLKIFFINVFSQSLLLPLKAKTIDSVLKNLYPKSVFDLYGRSSFLLVNHLTPAGAHSPLQDYKKYWLECLVGSFRSMVVLQMSNDIYAEESELYCVSQERAAALYARASEKSSGVKKALDANMQSIRNEFLESASSRKILLSMYVPIQIGYDECTSLIKALFPEERVFYFFNVEESLLLMHLAPQKKYPLRKKCKDEDRKVFTECLVGVMRSRSIRDFSDAKIDMRKYLGIESEGRAPTKKGIPYSQSSIVVVPQTVLVTPALMLSPRTSYAADHAHDFEAESASVNADDAITAASKAIRKIYTDSGIKIDPEMNRSEPPDWSTVPVETYNALVSAFIKNTTTEDGSRVLPLPADHAITLIHMLFPEGMFHMFNGAEYALMNLLHPTGRKLNPDERLFWMECLVGSQRSKYINEGIASPLENFNLEGYIDKQKDE